MKERTERRQSEARPTLDVVTSEDMLQAVGGSSVAGTPARNEGSGDVLSFRNVELPQFTVEVAWHRSALDESRGRGDEAVNKRGQRVVCEHVPNEGVRTNVQQRADQANQTATSIVFPALHGGFPFVCHRPAVPRKGRKWHAKAKNSASSTAKGCAASQHWHAGCNRGRSRPSRVSFDRGAMY
jgi:hypothetical protein